MRCQMRKDYGTIYAQCRYNTAGFFTMGSASRDYYYYLIIIITVIIIKLLLWTPEVIVTYNIKFIINAKSKHNILNWIKILNKESKTDIPLKIHLKPIQKERGRIHAKDERREVESVHMLMIHPSISYLWLREQQHNTYTGPQIPISLITATWVINIFSTGYKHSWMFLDVHWIWR